MLQVSLGHMGRSELRVRPAVLRDVLVRCRSGEATAGTCRIAWMNLWLLLHILYPLHLQWLVVLRCCLSENRTC